jgi:hypothetical protein
MNCLNVVQKPSTLASYYSPHNKIRLVVCGVHPSVHAAHQASAEEIGVSVTSVYNKINRTSTHLERASPKLS